VGLQQSLWGCSSMCILTGGQQHLAAQQYLDRRTAASCCPAAWWSGCIL